MWQTTMIKLVQIIVIIKHIEGNVTCCGQDIALLFLKKRFNNFKKSLTVNIFGNFEANLFLLKTSTTGRLSYMWHVLNYFRAVYRLFGFFYPFSCRKKIIRHIKINGIWNLLIDNRWRPSKFKSQPLQLSLNTDCLLVIIKISWTNLELYSAWISISAETDSHFCFTKNCSFHGKNI